MPTILRPDVVTVDRKVLGKVSRSGEPVSTITTIAEGLSIGINSIPVISKLGGGDYKPGPSNVVYEQTHLGFIDGLSNAQYLAITPTANPGDTVTLNGVDYIINAAGTAAFPDVQSNDRFTDQDGNQYLVVTFAHYVIINPSLQVRLLLGAAWTE